MRPALRRQFAAVPIAFACMYLAASGQQQDIPRPVRNDVPVDGTELLVFRHQKFHKGGHEAYYRLSRDGVWPWFEKIGSRIVGQWKVIHPDGSPEDPEFDSGYRLARYASYEHWKATRRGQLLLGGNGPDYQRSRQALQARNHYIAGSDGAHFLEGVTASTTVYYMPALEESYEPADRPSAEGPRPVRNDINWPAREIIALDRWRVEKGSADGLIQVGVTKVWPYLEKIGARIVGQWKAVYPPESGFPESADYDEVFMMVRYAGYEHWKAAWPDEISAMGGDGKDYEAFRSAKDAQDQVTKSRTVTFLEGYMYQSPPKFLPGLHEAFQEAE
ncbi:MAG: hypothetical protein OXC19_20800 [Bryobacterales bacterium]|nr:hypothetical protein [Bryobacterales bacterium]